MCKCDAPSNTSYAPNPSSSLIAMAKDALVQTIVFYPSQTPDNPQFLVDAVSPTMDIDNLGHQTFWNYATRYANALWPSPHSIKCQPRSNRQTLLLAVYRSPESGASPRTLRIGA